MKSLKRIFIAVALIFVIGATATNAQVKFGVKAGVAVNDMKFDKEVFDAGNRAGFTGGVMLEVMLPIANLGFDVSAMYVRRTTNITMSDDQGQIVANSSSKNLNLNRDYIEIPLNLKYKFGLPLVGKVVSPYIFTGPSFAFLTSKKAVKAVKEAYENKSFDVAWNVGLGVQVLNKVQVGASYGFGLTKALEKSGKIQNAPNTEGKNRYWTISAAYLF